MAENAIWPITICKYNYNNIQYNIISVIIPMLLEVRCLSVLSRVIVFTRQTESSRQITEVAKLYFLVNIHNNVQYRTSTQA